MSFKGYNISISNFPENGIWSLDENIVNTLKKLPAEDIDSYFEDKSMPIKLRIKYLTAAKGCPHVHILGKYDDQAYYNTMIATF